MCQEKYRNNTEVYIEPQELQGLPLWIFYHGKRIIWYNQKTISEDYQIHKNFTKRHILGEHCLLGSLIEKGSFDVASLGGQGFSMANVWTNNFPHPHKSETRKNMITSLAIATVAFTNLRFWKMDLGTDGRLTTQFAFPSLVLTYRIWFYFGGQFAQIKECIS